MKSKLQHQQQRVCMAKWQIASRENTHHLLCFYLWKKALKSNWNRHLNGAKSESAHTPTKKKNTQRKQNSKKKTEQPQTVRQFLAFWFSVQTKETRLMRHNLIKRMQECWCRSAYACLHECVCLCGRNSWGKLGKQQKKKNVAKYLLLLHIISYPWQWKKYTQPTLKSRLCNSHCTIFFPWNSHLTIFFFLEILPKHRFDISARWARARVIQGVHCWHHKFTAILFLISCKNWIVNRPKIKVKWANIQSDK